MPPTLILVTLGTRRTSAVRWLTLSALLQALERGVEASARLDAYADAHAVGRPRTVDQRARADCDARLLTLERRIDVELDRLTVERLAVDLAGKHARDRI